MAWLAESSHFLNGMEEFFFLFLHPSGLGRPLFMVITDEMQQPVNGHLKDKVFQRDVFLLGYPLAEVQINNHITQKHLPQTSGLFDFPQVVKQWKGKDISGAVNAPELMV